MFGREKKGGRTDENIVMKNSFTLVSKLFSFRISLMVY